MMTELAFRTHATQNTYGDAGERIAPAVGGKIVLIDDDKNVTNTVSTWLLECGYEVSVFNEPHRYIRSLGEVSAQLILLDWWMPTVNGPELLNQLRDHFHIQCPVIFITSMDDAQSIVRGLDSGADDYIVKPLVKEVLLARVRAVMRRGIKTAAAPREGNIVEGPYQLNLRQRSLTLLDTSIHLTPKEFELAWLLFSHIDQFLPKREALARLWGKNDEIDTHTLAQHIYALKKKLKLSEQGYAISVVYGSGYRLERRYEQ
jgi:DNA-binding response OmpR family regulator